MNRLDEMREVLQKTSVTSSARSRNLFYLLIFVGVASFLGAMLVLDVAIAWQALLVNVVFFAGIAQAALMFSVIATISDAFWLRPIKRVAEGVSTFGIFSIGFFILLFLGGKYFFEWYNHDLVIHTKEGWLNYNFFMIRQVIGLLIMALLTLIYLKNAIRPDLGLAKKLGFSFAGKLADLWSSDYKDHEQEAKKAYLANKQLAPWVGFVFSLVSSLVAFDWVMSIDQEWFSTMFGVQYMVSSLIGGGAILIIASGILQSRFGMNEYQTKLCHHDISKLTFAFTLLWTYMIFSQVLVIWYADLPEETPYMILRMQSQQWGWLYWVIFVVLFLIPFFGLMSRTACRSLLFSRIIAIDLLIGLWLEKYFLIAPSMQENKLAAELHGHTASQLSSSVAKIPGFEVAPFIINLLVGVGMLGLFLLWVSRVFEKFPLMAVADNRLIKRDH